MKIVVIGGTGLIGSKLVNSFVNTGTKRFRQHPTQASTLLREKGWPKF